MQETTKKIGHVNQAKLLFHLLRGGFRGGDLTLSIFPNLPFKERDLA
jgi:hypothetical protein